MEKYSIFLKDRNAIGDMMIESRNKEDDRELSTVYRRFFENGTTFIDDEELRSRLSSVEIKIKDKSDNIPGLQIADILVTNIRNRMLTKYKYRPPARNDEFGYILTNVVIPKIFKHKNKYWGYGLKKLP